MIRLIVFDWDGTLADSIESIVKCKIFLAHKYGLPEPSQELARSVIGLGFEQAMKRCFPIAKQNILRSIQKEFIELMQTEQYLPPLFPQVKRILLHLRKLGLKIAIATSKNSSELQYALYENSLENSFDFICCADQSKSKPNPEMLFSIMADGKVSPQETIMIGDTTTDIIFAHKAGVKVIAIDTGAHSEKKLREAGPYILIHDLMLVPSIIASMNMDAKISSRY